MPEDPPPRIVTLVLVTRDGEILGRLPPFRVDTPWWQDAEPVVGEARTRFGLDQPAFLSRIDPVDRSSVADHWHATWRRVVPGSDPDLASLLLAPVAAARQAVIYRRFLDNIEASELAYHRADVPDWLRRTADILRAESV